MIGMKGDACLFRRVARGASFRRGARLLSQGLIRTVFESGDEVMVVNESVSKDKK